MEFGFIAKTDKDIEVVETRLYKMQEEEYAEYLEDIGVEYYPMATYGTKASGAKYAVEPIVKYRLEIMNGDNTKRALQSYLWHENILFSLYAGRGGNISNAFLCQTKKNSAGNYVVKQDQRLKMNGFAHGQSFESFTRTVNGKDYNTFMMCAGASGNEAKGNDLSITCLTITEGASKVSKVSRIYIEIPYDKYANKIFVGTGELEGCHIKGEELQFLLTKSKKKGDESIERTPQYIVSIKKDRFSDTDAVIKS